MDWLKLKVFVLSEDENKWVHLEVILPYDENLQEQDNSFCRKKFDPVNFHRKARLPQDVPIYFHPR
jgi:hypothetical protein